MAARSGEKGRDGRGSLRRVCQAPFHEFTTIQIGLSCGFRSEGDMVCTYALRAIYLKMAWMGRS